MRHFIYACLVLLCSFAAVCGVSALASTRLLDEGVDAGQVTTLNCVGTGFACSRSGTTGTLFFDGGGTGGGVSGPHQFMSATHTDVEPSDAGDDKMIIANGSVWQAKTLTNCQNSTYALRYDAGTNQPYCGEISGLNQSLLPYIVSRQRPVYYAVPTTPTATSLTAFGMSSVDNVATPSTSVTDEERYYIRYTSDGGTSSAAVQQSNHYFYYKHSPRCVFMVQVPVATEQRVWVAVSQGLLGTADTFGSNVGMGFLYTPGSSTSGEVWQCCVGDGTTTSCSSTGVAPTGDGQILDVGVTYNSGGSTTTFKIDRTTVCTASSTGTAVVNPLGPQIVLKPKTTAVRTFDLSGVWCESN